LYAYNDNYFNICVYDCFQIRKLRTISAKPNVNYLYLACFACSASSIYVVLACIYQLLDDLAKNRIDKKKPRKEGLTFIVDKMQGLDRENLEILAPLIDMVKIYGAYPLLMSESQLERKIKFYHDFNILVSTGSTITESDITESSFDKFGI
jgi:hypothetical protein